MRRKGVPDIELETVRQLTIQHTYIVHIPDTHTICARIHSNYNNLDYTPNPPDHIV